MTQPYQLPLERTREEDFIFLLKTRNISNISDVKSDYIMKNIHLEFDGSNISLFLSDIGF